MQYYLMLIASLAIFNQCALCRPRGDNNNRGNSAQADSSAAAAVESGRRPIPVEDTPQIQILTPPQVNPEITIVQTQPQVPSNNFGNSRPVGVGLTSFGRPGNSASASSSASSSATSNGGFGAANASSAANASTIGKGNANIANASSSSSAVAVGK